MSTKPFTYRCTTDNLIDNAVRDFRMATEPSPMITVGEMSQWRQKSYSQRLFSFLEKCINNSSVTGDFIIEVHRWHEIADRCTLRYRFKQLAIVPTPSPGRAYYQYDAQTGELDLLWDLPPKRACEKLLKYRVECAADVPHALRTVLDWYDGTLKRRAIDINDSIVKKARKISIEGSKTITNNVSKK